MISGIGCEDCCGHSDQQLATAGAKLDDGTAAGWYNIIEIPNSGSIYTYGTNKKGNVQMAAGGRYDRGTLCGTNSRNLVYMRDEVYTSSCLRGSCDPL